MKKLSFLVTFLCSTGILLGTTTFAAFPVSPNTWAEINANPENYPNALALEMDEPLYNAIYDKYATQNVLPQLDDPNDASSKGWITTVEAGNWGGTSISLNGQGLTGSIRGIMYFVKLQKLNLSSNKLAGNIVGIGNLTNLTQLELYTNQFFGDIATIGLGNLTELTSINLGNNYIDGDISQAGLENLTKLIGFYCNSNRVSGNFDKVEWDKLVSLKTLEIVQNRLTGYVPTSLFTLPYLSVVGLYQNPHLTTPSVTEVPVTWTTYLNFGTITDETANLNRVSTQIHYAMPGGIPQNGDFFLLNRDINGDHKADINLIANTQAQIPSQNLDVNGDGKVDLNVMAYPVTAGIGGSMPRFNAATEAKIDGEFIGWIRRDQQLAVGVTKDDLMVSSDYPYYLVPNPASAKPEVLIAQDPGNVPVYLLTLGATPFDLNYDNDGDGIPDINIDYGNTGKPQYNVNLNGESMAYFNKGPAGLFNPIQSTYPQGLNYDADQNGRPDDNIDANGNGIVDSEENKPAPSPSSSGGGGASLSKDSCPDGDFSPSYYDKTCGTTADLADEVTKKVNVLRPLIVRIFLTATEAQKTFVHKLITSCSQTNKKEVIRLACLELVENWEF